MFNRQLTQYQLFIKNPPAKSVLKKTFLPCKIKMKNVLKIMKQPSRVVPRKQPFSQNNKISKILEKHSRKSPLQPKKWAPSWVFLKYFAYFIIFCVNGCFGETTLGGCFIILSTFFILILLNGRSTAWHGINF